MNILELKKIKNLNFDNLSKKINTKKKQRKYGENDVTIVSDYKSGEPIEIIISSYTKTKIIKKDNKYFKKMLYLIELSDAFGESK